MHIEALSLHCKNVQTYFTITESQEGYSMPALWEICYVRVSVPSIAHGFLFTLFRLRCLSFDTGLVFSCHLQNVEAKHSLILNLRDILRSEMLALGITLLPIVMLHTELQHKSTNTAT